MTSFKTFTALAAGAVVLSTAGLTQAQTPYTATPYSGPTQTWGNTPQDTFGQILGALFGTDQSLDSEWSRGRRPLNAGSAQFTARLDAGVRDGTIDRYDAGDYRREYQDLVTLESRYAADGRFTTQERSDLGQQYRDLTDRVDEGTGNGGYDNGGGYGTRWTPLIDGRADFDARLDRQQSARRLTRAQVSSLRTDYAGLIQLETSYQRGGIDAREQSDLQARLDALNVRVGDGYQGGGGYGGYGDSRARLAAIERALYSLPRGQQDAVRVPFDDLTRLEAAYARLNPTPEDRAYLDRRLGELEVQARVRR